MKTIQRPQEFGPLINFRRLPVVRIDVTDRDDYGLRGAPVVIDNGFFRGTNHPDLIDARLRAYDDEETLVFHQRGCCLTNTFTYGDMEKCLMYANAPIIKPGEEFLIVLVDSQTNKFSLPILVKTEKHVRADCSTPLVLEPVEWKKVPLLAVKSKDA